MAQISENVVVPASSQDLNKANPSNNSRVFSPKRRIGLLGSELLLELSDLLLELGVALEEHLVVGADALFLTVGAVAEGGVAGLLAAAATEVKCWSWSMLAASNVKRWMS